MGPSHTTTTKKLELSSCHLAGGPSSQTSTGLIFMPYLVNKGYMFVAGIPLYIWLHSEQNGNILYLCKASLHLSTLLGVFGSILLHFYFTLLPLNSPLNSLSVPFVHCLIHF